MWVVPPLTLGQLRRLMPKIQRLGDVVERMSEAQIDIVVEIVMMALHRNYPDVTAEVVEGLLDLGNSGVVLNAVLAGSGLKLEPRTSGEAGAPETGAATTAAIKNLNGEKFTGSLPPHAATATR